MCFVLCCFSVSLSLVMVMKVWHLHGISTCTHSEQTITTCKDLTCREDSSPNKNLLLEGLVGKLLEHSMVQKDIDRNYSQTGTPNYVNHLQFLFTKWHPTPLARSPGTSTSVVLRLPCTCSRKSREPWKDGDMEMVKRCMAKSHKITLEHPRILIICL